MAARKSPAGGTRTFWKQQLKLAEKRLEAFEKEAQVVLSDLVTRGRRSRAEIQELLRRAGETDLSGRAEEIRAQIEKSTVEMARRLEVLQEKALAALGVAGLAQVEELGAKVDRLSRKISKLSRGGPRRSPPTHQKVG